MTNLYSDDPTIVKAFLEAQAERGRRLADEELERLTKRQEQSQRWRSGRLLEAVRALLRKSQATPSRPSLGLPDRTPKPGEA